MIYKLSQLVGWIYLQVSKDAWRFLLRRYPFEDVRILKLFARVSVIGLKNLKHPDISKQEIISCVFLPLKGVMKGAAGNNLADFFIPVIGVREIRTNNYLYIKDIALDDGAGFL